MGLAGALGMRQARPCYWSQTTTKKFKTFFKKLCYNCSVGYQDLHLGNLILCRGNPTWLPNKIIKWYTEGASNKFMHVVTRTVL